MVNCPHPAGLIFIIFSNHNEAFHLDEHNTVLQAEVFAVGKTATLLLDNKIEGSKIKFDSQAAIRAIELTVIKSNTTLEATMTLNTLGESNEIRVGDNLSGPIYPGTIHPGMILPVVWEI